MRLVGLNTAVTGGASGLGLATARRLVGQGGQVTLVDLPGSDGERVAAELGETARFVAADVTDAESFAAALDVADSRGGLRALVHCAGAGRRMRILEKDSTPGSAEDFACWPDRSWRTATSTARRSASTAQSGWPRADPASASWPGGIGYRRIPTRLRPWSCITSATSWR
ncbi:SDR family NAD(P)-dependent oxidoreductase [Pseudonocardia sp.]|uniref:SDR family NAD(P)-dependent oxidoreductase n=1 Tax=Pseudonocardia sp. TaxID=60912 RepID=UPI0031FD0BE0